VQRVVVSEQCSLLWKRTLAGALLLDSPRSSCSSEQSASSKVLFQQPDALGGWQVRSGQKLQGSPPSLPDFQILEERLAVLHKAVV
jgi:hypothetical protein